MVETPDQHADEPPRAAKSRKPTTRADKRIVCPKCASPDVAKAHRRHYRHIAFLVLPPYKCSACGLLFEAPCGLFWCVLAGLVGAVAAVAALIDDIVPSIRSLTSATSIAKALVDLLLGAFVVIFGAWMVVVAVRTVKYTVGSAGRPLEE